ncbi:MAG: thioredoxin family protein [Deinococcales bacterium]
MAGLVVLVLATSVAAPFARAASVDLVLFWGQGCPHCAVARPFLEGLAADERVTLQSLEVYFDEANRRLFAAAGRAFGFDAGAVPTILIGDEVYVGFSEATARRLQARVQACLEVGCPDPWDRILAAASLPGSPPGGSAAAVDAAGPAALAPLSVPLIGRVALVGRSELATTALIAFVDGFNPCSLWLLSLLLAVVINTRSRRKVLLVGTTFLLVAAAVYALLLAGLVNVLALVGVLPWVRTGVALTALGFALVNLKDYVWYRHGPSLTIPEGRRPAIYRGIRGVMARERSTLPMIAATAAMAAGVTLFELPCTVGFPVLWADLVMQWHPGVAAFWGLLLVYLLVFLLDELALFGAAAAALRVTRLEERHGRSLKLLGGMVMLFLAAVLLLRPAWMNELLPATAVVGSAALAAGLVHLLGRSVSSARARATEAPRRRT